jgi:ring-1,2-phenylacetyl-CoA epoxidase subunit PaaC
MKEFSDKEVSAIKDLLLRMADDELILGHRNSEWTGLGPILEEDIAFSSMAQDKLGHSQAIYNILHSLGETDPDKLAFGRKENEFKCCHFVEFPIGEYDFSLMRHILFDASEAIRFEMLTHSAFEPVANVTKKFRGEIKYHNMHAETWLNQLCNGSGESKLRMQTALNFCFPLALGIFEPSDYESILIEGGIFPGEKKLQEVWIEHIKSKISDAGLIMPDEYEVTPSYGGRKGSHTEYLKPLLEEMTEVYDIDPNAEW